MAAQVPVIAPPSFTLHARCVRVLFEYRDDGRAIFEPINDAADDTASPKVWEDFSDHFDALFQDKICNHCYSWATDHLHEVFLGAKDHDPMLLDAGISCCYEEPRKAT